MEKTIWVLFPHEKIIFLLCEQLYDIILMLLFRKHVALPATSTSLLKYFVNRIENHEIGIPMTESFWVFCFLFHCSNCILFTWNIKQKMMFPQYLVGTCLSFHSFLVNYSRRIDRSGEKMIFSNILYWEVVFHLNSFIHYDKNYSHFEKHFLLAGFLNIFGWVYCDSIWIPKYQKY